MSAKGKKALLGLAVVLIAWKLPALSLEEVGNGLVCLCGCGLVLNNCSHTECGFALPARKLIQDRLKEGWSGQEIVAALVSQYGESVLAAPTKKGFNLTVWVLPFLSIIVGGAVIALLVRQWVLRRRYALASLRGKADPVPRPAATPETEKYEQIFSNELKRFE